MTNQQEDRASIYRDLLDGCTQMPLSATGFTAEQTEKLSAFLRPKTILFLAFPPKCGGTFLREALGTYLQLRGLTSGSPRLLRGSFVGEGDQERDLYFPELFVHHFGVDSPISIIHNHPTATNGNLALIRHFSMKPVIMKRSIQDMLLSIIDAGQRGKTMGAFGSSWAEDETFFELPEERQKDFLIYNVAPWYIKYYASWLGAHRRGSVRDMLFVTYDEFRAAPEETAARILRHYDIDVHAEDLTKSVTRATATRNQLRFNKGVSGRGGRFFSDEHREHLGRLVQSYALTDLSDLL